MAINPPLSSEELGKFLLGTKIAVFKFLRVFFSLLFHPGIGTKCCFDQIIIFPEDVMIYTFDRPNRCTAAIGLKATDRE